MLDPNFWQIEREKLAAILYPFMSVLSSLGAISAAQRLAEQGVTAEPGSGAAADWARQYTGALIEQIGSQNQKVVDKILATWKDTPGATRQDLIAQLRPVLADNDYRATLISTTEATRGVSGGDSATYQNAGIGAVVFGPPAHANCRCFTSPQRYKGGWVIIWESDRDERVCQQPIDTPWGTVTGCKELQNTVISEGEYLGEKI